MRNQTNDARHGFACRELVLPIVVLSAICLTIVAARSGWFQRSQDKKGDAPASKPLTTSIPIQVPATSQIPSNRSMGRPSLIAISPPRPPVLTGFKSYSVEESRGRVLAEELVLAVEINGMARAYPLNMMTGPAREVFNDTLGGRAIAATW